MADKAKIAVFQVTKLPLGVMVEIEAVARLKER